MGLLQARPDPGAPRNSLSLGVWVSLPVRQSPCGGTRPPQAHVVSGAARRPRAQPPGLRLPLSLILHDWCFRFVPFSLFYLHVAFRLPRPSPRRPGSHGAGRRPGSAAAHPKRHQHKPRLITQSPRRSGAGFARQAF